MRFWQLMILLACVTGCSLPTKPTVEDNTSKIRESSSVISENTRAVLATTEAMTQDMAPKMQALTLKIVELGEPIRTLAAVANGKFPILPLLAGAVAWVLLTAAGVALGMRLMRRSRATLGSRAGSRELRIPKAGAGFFGARPPV